MGPLAVPFALTLPASDGAFVEAKGCNYCLKRTSICQNRHDGGEQLMRVVHPVESCAFSFAERFGASLAAVTSPFLAVHHDVILTRSAVGPATAIVAKSFLRVVHATIGLLSLDTNKSAAGPACSSTLMAQPRLPGVLPLISPTIE